MLLQFKKNIIFVLSLLVMSVMFVSCEQDDTTKEQLVTSWSAHSISGTQEKDGSIKDINHTLGKNSHFYLILNENNTCNMSVAGLTFFDDLNITGSWKKDDKNIILTMDNGKKYIFNIQKYKNDLTDTLVLAYDADGLHLKLSLKRR